MRYFKLFNEHENHYGFQYKDGLNTDTIPFNDNPEHSCCAGGLYFSDENNIIAFLDYKHRYIREITIPEGGLVVNDGFNKFRAHSIKLGKRHDLSKLATWEWLNKIGVYNFKNAILWASVNGHVEVVKYLVDSGFDIADYDNWVVRVASERGHLEVVKYLVSVGADITVNDNQAIKWATENRKRDVVEYLLTQVTKIP